MTPCCEEGCTRTSLDQRVNHRFYPQRMNTPEEERATQTDKCMPCHRHNHGCNLSNAKVKERGASLVCCGGSVMESFAEVGLIKQSLE